MSRSMLVISREEQLVRQLGAHFSTRFNVTVAEDIAQMRGRIAAMSQPVVFAHWGPLTQDGMSRKEILDEFQGVADRAAVIGLMDPKCPEKLRDVAAAATTTSLPLPFDPEQLNRLVDELTKLEFDLAEFCRLRPHRTLRGETRNLLTFTESMFGMLDELRMAAGHTVPILLIGETGSGKTHLARLLHELSPRRSERCLTVACGTLPPNLIESELFGHAKGSFTGADQQRAGKFAAAENGTVILDEVDVLTPDQQAKLLRVIETGEYELVGSNDTQVSRAVTIVSSNRNLEELVAEGKFRKDLFYRLNTLSFVLPPLRERPLDIEYLLQKFALDHSRAYRAKIWRIEPEFYETMQRDEWPGNIREMDNVMRRACLYCRDGVLTPFELPGHVRASVPDARTKAVCGVKSALLERRVRETESQIITETLRRNNYRRTSTAEELGISRVTLYNKMRRLGILDSTRAAPDVRAEAEDKI